MLSERRALKTDLQLIQDVRAGLGRCGQKELHSRYLYDAIGSALFDVITTLPEYGLTRAGERLLERHAPDLAAKLTENVLVAELGSGSGTKTRWILSALVQRGPVDYMPIDISPAALARCKIELEQISDVQVLPLEHGYIEGLHVATAQRARDSQLLLLFLGSTIGNFDRSVAVDFLKQLRRILRTQDVLYIGTDLEKPPAQLLAAYNDAIGVTASFNLNILGRLNRELGANFDLGEFEHSVTYNERDRRIEMYLRSKKRQEITIPGAEMTVKLETDETIWTENSHKFNSEEVVEMGRKSGFRCEVQWIDKAWPFAQSMLVAE